jgi:hypothetical protein
MKLLFTVLIGVLFVSPVFAQQQQAPQIPPEVQSIQDQLGDVGCRAERLTAAQTIVQLQKQIKDLQAQVAKDPPPRSGATKH